MSAGAQGRISFYDESKIYLAAGLCVLPFSPQTKMPILDSWREFQDRRPTEPELAAWFAADLQLNIGFICGDISGGLVVFDFDHDADSIFSQFMAIVGDLVVGKQLPVIKSGKGYHVYARVPSAGRNTHLAVIPVSRKEKHILIETRANGGVIVGPPSIHESGRRYHVVQGQYPNIPILTADESDRIFAACRSFDKRPKPKPISNDHLWAYLNDDRRIEGLVEFAESGQAKSNRNKAAFWLATALIRSCADLAKCRQLVELFGSRCNPAMEQREVERLFTSAQHYASYQPPIRRLSSPPPPPHNTDDPNAILSNLAALDTKASDGGIYNVVALLIQHGHKAANFHAYLKHHQMDVPVFGIPAAAWENLDWFIDQWAGVLGHYRSLYVWLERDRLDQAEYIASLWGRHGFIVDTHDSPTSVQLQGGDGVDRLFTILGGHSYAWRSDEHEAAANGNEGSQ